MPKRDSGSLFFSNLFNINRLRAKSLKRKNFIFSFCFIFFDIFSYFLPLKCHNFGTSLS